MTQVKSKLALFTSMFSRLICSTADLQQVRKVFVIFLMSTLDSSYCTAPVNTFIDITKDLGLTSVKGTIGGFGDIDSDRDTDLIFISESSKYHSGLVTVLCTKYVI